MDIQMYLSLRRSIKEKLPIEVYFGGTVATKARVWGAQRLSGFRSVNNCLLSNPSRTPPPVTRRGAHHRRCAREGMTPPMMHQKCTKLQQAEAAADAREVCFLCFGGRRRPGRAASAPPRGHPLSPS